MKSSALHTLSPLSAQQIYEALKRSEIDWRRLEVEEERTVYGDSEQTEWFRFYPDDQSSYEEIGAIDFFNSLNMPFLWDIEYRSGNSLNLISECLRREFLFVIATDSLMAFNPDEIALHASKGEQWWK